MAGPTYEELVAATEKLRDAGDIQGANKMLAAAARVQRNQPKSFWEKTKETVGQDIQQLGDVALMAGRGLTIGQSPNIQGVLNVMMGGDFETGRQNQLAAEAAASERLGIMGMIPEIVGGVATGGAEVAAIKKLAGTPAAQQLGGWLGSILTGAAEGNVYAQGQGMDQATGTLLGGGAGALGKAVFTGLGKLEDMLPTFNIKEKAAQAIEAQTSRAGVSPADMANTLTSDMDRLGPSATLADVQKVRPAIVASLNPMSSVEAAADVYNTFNKQDRNVADLALTEWDTIFPTPRSQTELGENKKLTLDQAKVIYEDGLNTSTIKFDRDKISNFIIDTFGEKAIDKMRTARNALLTAVRIKTPLVDDGQGNMVPSNMKARDLLDIKEAADLRIKDVTNGAADAKTKRFLSIISKQINETLKSYIPQIRVAADTYSGQHAFEAGYQNGYELGKGGLKNQSLTDLRDMVAAFSPTQKAAFAEGWRKAKFEVIDTKGAEGQFKRVGPTMSNADLEVIDTLFGPGKGQQFADSSHRITAISDTNAAFENKWQQVSGAAASPKGTALDLLRHTLDVITMGSQMAQRKMMGGAFQGAFGREGRAVGSLRNALAGDQIIKWGTQSGQAAEDAMREIQQYLSRSKPQPINPELLRSGVQIGTAAERSMRGPQ